MRKIMIAIGLSAVFILSINACKNKTRLSDSNIDAIQKASGIYTGILPCANCSGIQTRVEINTDLTYTLQIRYMDESEETDTVSGKFEWNSDKNTITFDEQLLGQYTIEDHALYKLVDGIKEEGENAENYTLVKVDQNLVEKSWKLLELHGSQVAIVNNKEANIIFHIDGNRFSGNASCNRFNGSYHIKENNRIIFSQTVATKMMCINMKIETEFMEVLSRTESYSIENDTLILTSTQMAPLAKLVAI
ncbi:MAG: META domain-containing protein [Bacteroidales bacterium]|jgi:heat shock protein HslJ|nr:META domain-containing protein [Bacteroidales bacterium]